MKRQLDDRVTIRLAKPEDKNIIVKIQFNALKVLAVKDYSYQQLNALLKSKSIPRKSRETIFIAEINSQPVGFASLIYPYNTIGAVFIAPNFARQKIGTKLLQRLEQEAIAHRVPILWVYSSLNGYGFYRANGYQTITKTFLPLYSTYIPCVQMKKRLLPLTAEEIFQEIYQLLTVLVLTNLSTKFLSLLWKAIVVLSHSRI